MEREDGSVTFRIDSQETGARDMTSVIEMARRPNSLWPAQLTAGIDNGMVVCVLMV